MVYLLENIGSKMKANDMNYLKGYIFKEVYQEQSLGILKQCYRKHFCPQTNSVYLIRKAQLATTQISRIFYRIILMRRYGITLGRYCTIGVGLKLPHPTGITIGDYVTIGKNAVIYQNTTFGTRLLREQQHNLGKADYPTIGDNCTICVNAMAVGGIKVADNTTIGAGAVLLTDTVLGGTYVGVPAKNISVTLQNKLTG